MQDNRKKIQIIKCYLNEILPNLYYTSLENDLKLSGELKYASVVSLDNSNLKEYIKYEYTNNLYIHLDFNNSSIRDIYKGLTIISNEIKG